MGIGIKSLKETFLHIEDFDTEQAIGAASVPLNFL
jgi:hypothetical protein